MSMTLYFKRAKAFVSPSENDKGTKKFLAQPGPTPQPVPNWVADTPTFKQGIKDGSIVNLTPPHLMPGYKAEKPAPVEEAVSDGPAVEEATGAKDEADKVDETGDDIEQSEKPEAPFGGQPMTPVPPAPRVGGVRANTKAK